MKKKISILFIVIIITVIPIIFFSFFISKTRCIPEIKINLEIEKSKNGNIYNLSNSSLEQLEKILKEFNYSANPDKLIQVFEREREHYIVLITIISLIITVFSVFMILHRFVEKDEYEKLNNDLIKQKEEIEKQLVKLKYINLCLHIDSRSESFRNMSLFYSDYKLVDSIDMFIDYVEALFIEYVKEINECFLPGERDEEIIFSISNFINGAMIYSKKHKWTDTIEFSTDNIIFKSLIKVLQRNIKNEFYDIIKNKINKIHDEKVNFGNY